MKDFYDLLDKWASLKSAERTAVGERLEEVQKELAGVLSHLERYEIVADQDKINNLLCGEAK